MDTMRDQSTGSRPAAFSAELFLSTDGKHTVHVTADTPQGRDAAGDWAVTVYRWIVRELGTQPQMWAGVRSSGSRPAPARRRVAGCPHPGQVVKEVRKAGANHGRRYVACSECGEFLGWDSRS